MAGGRWQVAGGKWQGASGRGQVAGGKWQGASGGWQVAGGRGQVGHEWPRSLGMDLSFSAVIGAETSSGLTFLKIRQHPLRFGAGGVFDRNS